MTSRRNFTWYICAAIAIFFLTPFFFSHKPVTVKHAQTTVVDSDGEVDAEVTLPKKNYAFATYLSEPNEEIKPDEEDYYFMSVRMINFAINHDPATKSKTGYPVVVMVTPDVAEWKREQLTREGAIVKEIEPISIDWAEPGRKRWVEAFNKLNLFRMIEYERILFFDSDMVIVKNIDGMLEDPAVVVQQNRGNPDQVKDDEAPQPQSYLLAGNGCGMTHEPFVFPIPRTKDINSGLMILRPDMDLFNHYMSVANIPNRFNSSIMDQNMLNYIHRAKGNMPWAQIDYKWMINKPLWEDYLTGIYVVHDKYWRTPMRKLKEEVLLRARYRMETYFDLVEQGMVMITQKLRL